MKTIGKMIAAAASVAALSFAVSPAQAAPAKVNNCFMSSDWQGWSAPNPNTLYLRVRMHDVYRVDLASGSNQLTWPGVHLVSRMHGSNYICSPLDLSLSVSDSSGVASPLFVKAITKLSPQEAAAIPRKYQP
jgi:hypothetical protein